MRRLTSQHVKRHVWTAAFYSCKRDDEEDDDDDDGDGDAYYYANEYAAFR